MRYLLGGFLVGLCFLVVGTRNPVHSILLLIRAFVCGSLSLFRLGREYIALLFRIVYVGAIVVLFLFLIRRLEIKRVNAATRYEDLFALRHLVALALALEVLLLVHGGRVDLTSFLSTDLPLVERNTQAGLARDGVAHRTHRDSFRALGGLLYTTAAVPLLLAATLLFLARIGGIVLTLESPLLSGLAARGVKTELPEAQALRHPTLSRVA